MGGAYDAAGHLLGSVEAESMKEAFDKIREQIPEAAEYRIKDLSKQDERVISQERMLQFFVFAHLPPHLQKVSAPFCDLATIIVATLPSNPERTVALRKLLEAKDCAVRALLYK